MNDNGLIEFIEALKENRCLWDPSDASYTNRHTRKAAQTALLNIFQKYDPNASIASVRRKIDNLKSTYQRERKKVDNSENTGSTSNCMYVPSLWYYDHLHFLSEAYKVVKAGAESPDSLGQHFLDDDEEERQEVRQQSEDDASDFRPPPPKALKRKQISAHKQQTAIERITNTLETGGMDNWDAFGLSVGGDLRNLENKQQTVAQKLISDVIFLAKMGRLSEGSTVADIPIHLVSPSPSASSIISPNPLSGSANGPLSPYNDVPATPQSNVSNPSKYCLHRDSGLETKYYISKPQILANDPNAIPTEQQQPEHTPLPRGLLATNELRG